jgi:hypothetical protein
MKCNVLDYCFIVLGVIIAKHICVCGRMLDLMQLVKFMCLKNSTVDILFRRVFGGFLMWNNVKFFRVIDLG